MIEEEILNESNLDPKLIYGIRCLSRDNKLSIDEHLDIVISDTIATSVKIKKYENLIRKKKDEKVSVQEHQLI